MERFSKGESVTVRKNTKHRGQTGEVKKVRESTHDKDGNPVGRYEVDFSDGDGVFVYEDEDLDKAPPQAAP